MKPDRCRQLLQAILDADERGQGIPYAEAMDAAKAWLNGQPFNDRNPTMPRTPRQCGTCRFHTDKDADSKFKLCMWALPPLPFWAAVRSLKHEGFWTHETQGRNCKTWEPKPA